jgi:hypothetical protein
MRNNTNEYLDFGKETVLVLKSGVAALVSALSVPLIEKYTWCQEGTGYIMSRTTSRAVKLHRLITGAHEGEYVDHIDGDPLNNTIENLRICTKQQNEFNQKRRIDNTSGYRGVCSYGKDGKYRAYINVSGKYIHIGVFDSSEEAAKAYDCKAAELYGEFARFNFV